MGCCWTRDRSLCDGWARWPCTLLLRKRRHPRSPGLPSITIDDDPSQWNVTAHSLFSAKVHGPTEA